MADTVVQHPAQAISIDQAKTEKLFYVVANVVVYRRSDGRCLLLKRHDREIVHPGKYGVIGGKFEWLDYDLAHPGRMNGSVIDFPNAIEDLLSREAMEEAGIAISRSLAYLNSVAYVRPDGVPAILVKFAAEYAGGDVKLEMGSFSDYVWANEGEAQELPCIHGIVDEIRQTIRRFSTVK
ncbi:NUDIX domain-containing protein [Candidatus Berkelbacteria bacterium]|nr:NUDIX domain-containing protein [Candidatus Berkelbacteria bacterium]